MKQLYAKSLITTASSNTNVLKKNNKIKITCLFSKTNKTKSKNKTLIKSKSNDKPIKKTIVKKSNIKENITIENIREKHKKSKPKILNITWIKDIKKYKKKKNIDNNNDKLNLSKTILNENNSIRDLQINKFDDNTTNNLKNENDDSISNFLNYNLGEIDNDQEIEEDNLDNKINYFLNNIIDNKNKNKSENKNKRKISEKEFNLSKFNEELININDNSEEKKKKKILFHKKNISTQNSSYYYSNTEELKSSEKKPYIYNSNFSLLRKMI